MGVLRPPGSVADRLAAAEATALVGRAEERARLTALLRPDGPAAVFVHGPGGIGKTSLVRATLAALPLTAVHLDGRHTEPTVPGALTALGAALGIPPPPSVGAAVDALADAGVDVLVVDAFERLNLLDGWIRNDLAAALPATATTLLVGRRGPNAAWRTAPGWRTLLAEIAVGPMGSADVDQLLAARGVPDADAIRIRRFARGHPLAAVVAAEALARRPGLPLGSGAPAEVVEELFAVMLDDLAPEERATVEAAAVLRRVTLPLLAAVVGDQDPQDAWRTLHRLPFTTVGAAGLEFTGVAATVLLEAQELRDPVRVRDLRIRAARVILAGLATGPDWEGTADLLHLVQNPLVRNAYAPPGMLQHPAERARAGDVDQVVDIAGRFEGPESARLAALWWRAQRDCFAVVRGDDGRVAGFSAIALLSPSPGELGSDPVIAAAAAHLHRRPMPPGADAIVFRWALSSRSGEQNSPEVGTLVVDLKRTYLERRATLRQVYTVVADWDAAAPVLRVMGFDVLSAVPVGDRRFALACLDFGPGGVDAWIGRHVLAEQGAAPTGTAQERARPSLLTLTAREQEVLALLAEGMTNVRLAETLFISERTANRHVSNIFTKLGVHNRTQAARAAVAAGLVG